MTMHAVIENVSRRRFLSSVATAAGFVVALQFIPFRSAFAYETGAGEMPHGTVNDPHIFVSIAEDGTVTIVRHRSEHGPIKDAAELATILRGFPLTDALRAHADFAPADATAPEAPGA